MKTIATKEEIIAAGFATMKKGRQDNQVNHQKVIDWIRTLSNIPSTATDPYYIYVECYEKWYEKNVEDRVTRYARLAKEAIGF